MCFRRPWRQRNKWKKTDRGSYFCSKEGVWLTLDRLKIGVRHPLPHGLQVWTFIWMLNFQTVRNCQCYFTYSYLELFLNHWTGLKIWPFCVFRWCCIVPTRSNFCESRRDSRRTGSRLRFALSRHSSTEKIGRKHRKRGRRSGMYYIDSFIFLQSIYHMIDVLIVRTQIRNGVQIKLNNQNTLGRISNSTKNTEFEIQIRGQIWSLNLNSNKFDRQI